MNRICRRESRLVALSGSLLLGLLVLSLLLALLASRPDAATAAPFPPVPYAPDVLLLKLADPALADGRSGRPALDALLAEYGAGPLQPLFPAGEESPALAKSLGLERIYRVSLPAGSNIPQVAAAFAANPYVIYAEPDYAGVGAVFPNDDLFGLQWHLQNTGQGGGTAGADVDAPLAWDVTTGSVNTTIAIIDTGLDLDHPDLAGKILSGYDFVNNDTVPQDDHGHGTHVAGLAAANSNNDTGTAGLCWQCRLMPLKGLNADNWGYYSWWASAIYYAVNTGADVINMSMGGTDPSSVLYDAVNYAYVAGVPVVAAMMNSGNSTPYIPAAYPQAIAVGATDRHDNRSSYSNFGTHIDLVAPGTDVWSTALDNTYEPWIGTSMAVANVSGVLGLLHSLDPTASVEQYRAWLRTTAEDQVGPGNEDTPGWDPYYGSGRLNARQAVLAAAGPLLTDVTITGPTRGLTDTALVFTATVSSPLTPPPITYVWQIDGQEDVVAVAGPRHSVTLTWPLTGSYILTVTASNNFAEVSDSHVISIEPPLPPEASFVASRLSGPAPLLVEFSNLSTGDYLSSTWDFGDGITSTLTNPSHTYVLTGVYTVSLTVVGPAGTSTLTRTEYISVVPGFQLYLPVLSRP